MGLQWATLTEYAPNGTVVQSVDLSTHHFGWSQPDVYTVLDDLQYATVDKMPHVNFTATLVNGATFIVNAWIYTNDSAVNWNKRDDVKFTITIENWAWVGTGYYNYGGEVPGAYTGDYLVLTAGLVGYGGIVRSWDNTGSGTNATLVEGDFVYGVLISPDQAAYDGVYHPVPVSHTLSGKPEVSWTFTYFQNNVTYDPTQRNCGGHCPQQQEIFLGSPGMISMTVILGVVAIGIMVFLFVYIIRSAQRRRSSSYQIEKAQESGDVPMSSNE